MFTEDRMRIAKNKSPLKKGRQLELSSMRAGMTYVLVINGFALLWVIHCPADSIVQDYVSNVKQRIQKGLRDYNVYLVFDRYCNFSTKSVTRGARVHHVKLNTTLPSQKVAMTVIDYKKQLF